MGFALSLLGVKGKSPDAILADLHLRPTGVRGLEGDAPVVGEMSGTGWYLVIAQGAEHRLISAPVVERLSQGCDVLTYTVEEHVMFSEATGWRNGRRLWAVTHRGEDGPVGIDAQGDLPPEYAPIRDDHMAQQEAAGGDAADVDCLFDIPVVLVQRFTGYKHDDVSSADVQFEVLESTEPSGKPATSWVRRLFGGGDK